MFFGASVPVLLTALLSFATAVQVPGAYIFEFTDGHDTSEFLGAVHKHGKVRMNLKHKLFNGASVQLNNDINAEKIASEIASLPCVKQMWPMESHGAPSTRVDWVGHPVTKQAGGLQARATSNESNIFTPHVMTQVDKLRAKGITGKGIKVAVIDGGIDYTHPALGGCFGDGCLVARGHDFVGDAYDGTNDPVEDDDPMDCGGHGTHVAGIIAAQPNHSLGFTGAAPDVSLGAYRVFGCEGLVQDDILLAALNRAYDDGNDIITISINEAKGWSENPWTVAVSRIVEKGVPCTVSAGNDGLKGMFYTGSAADGTGVASIAAFDNGVLPTIFYPGTYTVDGRNTSTFQINAGAPKMWDNVSLPLWTGNFNPKVAADGCTPLNTTEYLGNHIVLVRNGDCPWKEKVANAAAKGAKYVLLYHFGKGTLTVDLTGVSGIGGIKGIGMVSAKTGEAWIQQLKEGKKVVVTIAGQTTAAPRIAFDNNKNSGAPMDFTSWGPTWHMDVKPQFGAPGGHILSTYPVKKGTYAVMGGTSMACPLTAAVYALIFQVRGKMSPAEMQNLLSANSDPQLFNNMTGSGFLPYLAPVAQQGGGMIRAYDAAYATTLLEPSSLSFNDTDAFINMLNFTISNKNKDGRITYGISHVPAVTMYTLEKDSIYAQSFPNEVVMGASVSLQLSESNVTIEAGESVTIEVIPTPPKGVDARRLALWSGYVTVNGSDGTSLSIPYQGLTGSLRNATVLGAKDALMAVSADAGKHVVVPANTIFMLPKPGSPENKNSTKAVLLAELALGSRLVRVEVVPANGTLSNSTNYTAQIDKSPFLWQPRGERVYEWSGKLSSGKYAPEGTYTLRTHALRIRGDERKEEDYDVSVSQKFSIRYL